MTWLRTFAEQILDETKSQFRPILRLYALFGCFMLIVLAFVLMVVAVGLPSAGTSGMLKQAIVMYAAMFHVALAMAIFSGVVGSEYAVMRLCLLIAGLLVLVGIGTFSLIPG